MTTAIRREAQDVARGVCGGMLFGIPLLFTMEVWGIATISSPRALCAVLVVTFLVVFALNRTSGFRSTRDVRFVDAVKDSVEALAIAIVSVFGVLVLIREITGATPLHEAAARVVYEAAPFAFGVGLATHLLRGDRTGTDDESASQPGDGPAINPTVADLGATLIGAVFVAFNIAPTEEIAMVSAALEPAWLLGFVVVSLVLSYGIVFTAGFSSQEARRAQAGVVQHPVTETAVCYLLSLAAAVAMLWFFQRWESSEPVSLLAYQAVVLGLPATIGGAAGRLAV